MKKIIHLMNKLSAARFLLFAILLAVMAGCGGAPVQKPTGEFFWPSPPDRPKVKWVTWWSGRQDFEAQNAVLTFLIGEERAETLLRPNGVVADPEGNIYVADSDAGMIFVFDLQKKTLRFLGEGLLAAPVSLAINNKDGIIYVADSKKHFVVGLDKKSDKVVTGVGASGEFENPAGVAFDQEKERIYVSDSKAHNLKAFDKNGKLLFTIGKRGDADGEFNFPTCLAFHNGKLYVTDTLNYRIQILDGEGKFLKKFGKNGDAPGYLSRPKGIGVDSDGHIYVVDAAFNNFQVFDEEGLLLLWVGQTGRREPGSMDLPSGLYVDQQDRIYVSDTFNKRVQVFQYLK